MPVSLVALLLYVATNGSIGEEQRIAHEVTRRFNNTFEPRCYIRDPAASPPGNPARGVPSTGPVESQQPCIIKGDFDGDGVVDTAVLAIQRSDKTRGVIFLMSRAGAAIAGPTNPIGNGGGDYRWLDAWALIERDSEQAKREGITHAPGRFDAVMVKKTGSASALIYWSGSELVWYQLGD